MSIYHPANEHPYRDDVHVVGAKPTIICAWCKRIISHGRYAVEWSDEWSVCDACNKAVRTEPDGYDWRPNYKIGEGSILCADCASDSDDDETDEE